MMIDRRFLLGAGGALALAPFFPAIAADTKIAAQTVDLAVSATRSTKLTVWRPAKPKGIVLFSTGHSSWPERYGLLVDLLTANGFAVFAPLHVDSMHYPDRAKFNPQAGFSERLFDMKATAAYASAALPGLPVIAAGHSFGTLTALCFGGSLGYFGTFRNPAVKAVLGFSTPGKIPVLVQPNAYATLAVPTLLITGTKDVVPGFAENPADHLFPIESSPAGGKFAIVLNGADHGLVADPAQFARVQAPVKNFLAGYAFDRTSGKTALARYKASGADTFIVRNTAI